MECDFPFRLEEKKPSKLLNKTHAVGTSLREKSEILKNVPGIK